MKLPKLRSSVLLAASMLIVLGQSAGSAFAAATKATSTTKPTAVSNSLKLSPLRTDVTINPGSSGTVKVYVTNITGNTVVLQAIENDFISGDEKGTPSLILDQNSYAPTHSLKRYMVPVPNVTLSPQATKEVDVTIMVPKSAQAGGYFGAIRFAPAANSGQPVSLNAGVASLILMTVPGPTVEQLNLTNFDIQQNGGSASSFRTPTNLSVLVRFQNKGNLQEAPFGQIYVQKGKKVVYTYNFNSADPKDEVLPDSARRWTVPLKNLGKFGKYTIGATFTYSSQGKSIQVSKTIWIIPTTYIIAGVIAVIALIVIIVFIWMFLRSYKRRILRSSRRRY